uniref:Chemokine interleukin-8-like domain-containing protein n=1 Tax=Amazona collaria TaxID=241587 RepID=A0A8B9F3H0_9PSIT
KDEITAKASEADAESPLSNLFHSANVRNFKLKLQLALMGNMNKCAFSNYCFHCEFGSAADIISFPPFLSRTVMMLAAELRCHCIWTVIGLILPKLLANVEIIPKGPHCDTVKVIATLENGKQICLDPQAK